MMMKLVAFSLMSISLTAFAAEFTSMDSQYDCDNYAVNSVSIFECQSKSNPAHKHCMLSWTGPWNESVAAVPELNASLEHTYYLKEMEGELIINQSTPRGETTLTKYFPISIPTTITSSISEIVNSNNELLSQYCEGPFKGDFSRYDVVTTLSRKDLSGYELKEFFNSSKQLKGLYLSRKDSTEESDSINKFCHVRYEDGRLTLAHWINDTYGSPLPPGNIGHSEVIVKSEMIESSEASQMAQDWLASKCK